MRSRTIAAALLLSLACGGGDDDGSEPGGPDAAPGGDGPLAAAEGQFFVHEVIVGEDLSRGGDALGLILDPRPEFYQLAVSEGACRGFTHEPTFCGDCYGICDAEGVCQPFPTSLAAGTLHVGGTSQAFILEEEWGYRPSEPLPAELFEAEDPVTLETDGGDDVAAFSLAAAGTDPIEMDLSEGEDSETGQSPGQNTLVLDDSQDLVLQWTDAMPGARVRLELRGRNQGHGQPLDGLVVCEADDSGGLTVPRAVLEAFPAHPYESICDGRDCPLARLIRFTRDRRTVDGREMELEVGARRDFVVVH